MAATALEECSWCNPESWLGTRERAVFVLDVRSALVNRDRLHKDAIIHADRVKRAHPRAPDDVVFNALISWAALNVFQKRKGEPYTR